MEAAMEVNDVKNAIKTSNKANASKKSCYISIVDEIVAAKNCSFFTQFLIDHEYV